MNEITKRQKIILSSIGVSFAILLTFTSGLRIPLIDTKTDNYFHEAITKAGITYATCRAINASVSIIQNSDIDLSPTGMGISLAVGRVLDPINDMTERLSNVLVTAITSLGIQKMTYDISISLVPYLLSICLFILSILIWFNNVQVIGFQQGIIKIILVLIIARFCLPLSSLANDFVNEHYFTSQISEAEKRLELESPKVDVAKDFSMPKDDSILEIIKYSASSIKQKAIEFKNAFNNILSNTENIIENLLKLTILYVEMLLTQIIILPLLSFWLFVKLAKILFQVKIPVILRHPKLLKINPIRQIKQNDI